MKSNKKKNIDTCDIKGIYYINTFPINYLLDTLITLIPFGIIDKPSIFSRKKTTMNFIYNFFFINDIFRSSLTSW